jgi:hypothetical protein
MRCAAYLHGAEVRVPFPAADNGTTSDGLTAVELPVQLNMALGLPWSHVIKYHRWVCCSCSAAGVLPAKIGSEPRSLLNVEV